MKNFHLDTATVIAELNGARYLLDKWIKLVESDEALAMQALQERTVRTLAFIAEMQLVANKCATLASLTEPVLDHFRAALEGGPG